MANATNLGFIYTARIISKVWLNPKHFFFFFFYFFKIFSNKIFFLILNCCEERLSWLKIWLWNKMTSLRILCLQINSLGTASLVVVSNKFSSAHDLTKESGPCRRSSKLINIKWTKTKFRLKYLNKQKTFVHHEIILNVFGTGLHHEVKCINNLRCLFAAASS